MTLFQWRLSVVGLILLACGQSAFGGNYADPSGFSFTYPEGWVPITHAAVGDVNVDFSRVAMVLILEENPRRAFTFSCDFYTLVHVMRKWFPVVEAVR